MGRELWLMLSTQLASYSETSHRSPVGGQDTSTHCRSHNLPTARRVMVSTGIREPLKVRWGCGQRQRRPWSQRHLSSNYNSTAYMLNILGQGLNCWDCFLTCRMEYCLLFIMQVLTYHSLLLDVFLQKLRQEQGSITQRERPRPRGLSPLVCTPTF